MTESESVALPLGDAPLFCCDTARFTLFSFTITLFVVVLNGRRSSPYFCCWLVAIVCSSPGSSIPRCGKKPRGCLLVEAAPFRCMLQVGFAVLAFVYTRSATSLSFFVRYIIFIHIFSRFKHNMLTK